MSSINKIVVLGTGNVAWHLCEAFHKSGADIVQVFGRQAEKASTYAKRVQAEAITEYNAMVEDADLYLLCISDGNISEVAHHLKHVKGIVAHTSGAMNMSVLEGLNNIGVFYPLQTFTTGGEVDFEQIPILCEGNSSYVESALMSLAFNISQKVYAISSAQREKLHVAAVFANNFTNHMLTASKQICDENKIPFEVLRPLIEETMHKAFVNDPFENQTGPAIRGDVETIAKHEAVLAEQPDLLEVYKIITQSINTTHETKL